jgi:hypothetical protein
MVKIMAMAEIRKEAPTPEVFGPEEALARVVSEMLSPQGDKLKTVTDVTPQEIFGLATIQQYAKVFGSTLIEGWVKEFLLLRISRLRLSRREFVLLSAGIRETGEKKRGGKVQDLYAGLR